jgi:DNA-binding NarL/FixJ family response regulator
MPTTVLVVDDHALVRLGIRELLSTAPEFRIVGEESTARGAFALVDARRPDIVLMDLGLPGMDGVVATREIKRRASRTRVLILTVHDHIQDVLDALEAGAAGYVHKSDDAEALLGALRAVARGERYLSPPIADKLAAYESRGVKSADMLAVLSGREREVFRLAARCLLAREIAHELCISRKTVDTHLSRIHLKLGVRSSAELVRLAARLGMLHGDPRPQAPCSAAG